MADRRVTLTLQAQVNQYNRGMEQAARSTEQVSTAAENVGTDVSRSSEALHRMSGGVSGIASEAELAAMSFGNMGSGLDGLSASFASGLDYSYGLSDSFALLGASAIDTVDGVREIGREWSATSRDMRSEMTTVGAGFVALGGVITGIGASLLNTGIEYNSLQQVAGKALETMTGSASEAADQMDRLNEFASTSPFFRQTWLEAQRQLMAFGMAAEDVVPTLEGVEEAVAAIGGGDQEIMRLVDILGQIQGQGQITGRELQRMGQMGIDAASLMGESMGVTGGEIRDQITAGAIDAETAIAALTDGMMMNFEGSADAIRETMDGAKNDLIAAWRDLGSILAAPLVDPDGGGFLVGITNEVADFLRAIQELPDPMIQVVGAMGGLAGAATLAYGGMFLLAPQIAQFRDAQAALSAAMPRTNRLVRGFGRAAGFAGGAAGALLLVDSIGQLTNTEHNVSRMSAQVEADMRGIRRGTEQTAHGFEDFSASTGNLWQGEVAAATAMSDLDGLGGAMSRLDHLSGSLTTRVWGLRNEWGGLNQDAVDRNELEAQFESLDQALVNLIQDGHIDIASEQLQLYAGEAAEAGYSTADLGDLLPDVAEALIRLGTEGDLTAEEMEQLRVALSSVGEGGSFLTPFMDSARDAIYGALEAAHEGDPAMEQLGEALEEVGLAADGTVESLETFIDKLFEAGLLTQSVMEAEAAFESQLRDVDQSVQTLTDSLTEDYIAKGYSEDAARSLAREQVELGHVLNDTKDGFDLTTDAGEEAQNQFFGVADSGRDMARALAENDASQSEVQGALRRTYDSLIETGQGFGMTEDDARSLAREVLGIPDDATIDSWMDDEAKQVAEETKRAIDDIDGRRSSSFHTHTINEVRQTSPGRAAIADPGLATFHATGGPIIGPGTGTSDSIPAWLSNGEHVLTARDVQALGGQSGVYRMRSQIHQGPRGRDMVPGYAAGGAVQARQMAAAMAGAGGGSATATLAPEDRELLMQVADRPVQSVGVVDGRVLFKATQRAYSQYGSQR